MKDIPCPVCRSRQVHYDADVDRYVCRECGKEWDSLIAVAHHQPDPQRNLEEFTASHTSAGDQG